VRSRKLTSTWSRRKIDRRHLLRGAVVTAMAVPAAALTGCGLLTREPDTPPSPDPLAPLIAGALDLAARYEAVIAAHPELTSRLEPLLHAHREHAAELARWSGTATPTASPVTPSPAASTPGDVRTLLAELREAERAGQQAAVEACRAAPAHQAALLGSIAAARATHVEVLA
jgi:hypothetical protein